MTQNFACFQMPLHPVCDVIGGGSQGHGNASATARVQKKEVRDVRVWLEGEGRRAELPHAE